MKNTMLVVIAALALALGGCVDLSKYAPLPTATTRSAVLSYESPDGTSTGRTRALGVEIPSTIKYKNTYLRQFVSNYVGSYNLEVAHQADYWAVQKQSYAKDNATLYHGEHLKPVRDLDTIAPDDVVPSYDSVKYNNDLSAAVVAGSAAAKKDAQALVKQER